jgi:hypothetical protein
LLAPVIDAPTPPGRAPKLSPEELRSRQLAALAAWVLAGWRTVCVRSDGPVSGRIHMSEISIY